MFFSVGFTQEGSQWTRIAELVWFIPVCCRRKGRFDLVLLWRQEEQHQPQSNDTSGWIQQAEKMCLLMSDRADTAPFSQLMLLLPSISISAADWADMCLNFLTSCVCEYPLRNSGSAWLAGGSLLAEGPEPAPDLFYFCTLFNFLYPAFPGLSFQTSFKLRVVEIFLNTAGQKAKHTGQSWPYVWC